MCVYKDTTDDKKLKAARAHTLVTSVVAGIAVNSGSSGQPASYVTSGRINLGATLLRGEVYVVSDDAAGAIVPFADLEDGGSDYVSLVGVAISSSILQLCILPSEVTLESH
ncbi:MAG: hypothetical protein C0485_19315 [Pirellula sp.]|nr:hypothetical protein [Pirellula sp.]